MTLRVWRATDGALARDLSSSKVRGEPTEAATMTIPIPKDADRETTVGDTAEGSVPPEHGDGSKGHIVIQLGGLSEPARLLIAMGEVVGEEEVFDTGGAGDERVDTGGGGNGAGPVVGARKDRW